MKRYIAELIGTFTLVFCGCGAIVTNDFSDAVTHSGIALTFGLVVMALIYAFGETSGAHFNPAVTIGFWFAKKFPSKEVPKYIVSQCIGAILGAAMLWVIFPENTVYLGTTIPQIDIWRVFLFEVLLTFFLMMVIINVSTGAKEIGIMAGIAIGGVVWFEAQFAGPITGASMNPARSLGPAVISGHLDYLWLYITAPIIGAILAVLSCKLVKDDNCCDTDC